MPAPPITVFEVITAVAFHLFAQTPADLCVLEVGLGGRGDATNVIDAAGGLRDHLDLARSSRNARRHAGRDRGGEGRDHEARRAGGDRRAAARGADGAAGTRRDASVRRCGCATRDWHVAATPRGFRYDGCAGGTFDLPPPSLPGAFQLDNAGIAIAAMRAGPAGAGGGDRARASLAAEWPARLQRLHGALGCAAAAGLGAVARRRPQSRRRRRCWPSICEAGRTGRCIWSSA